MFQQKWRAARRWCGAGVKCLCFVTAFQSNTTHFTGGFVGILGHKLLLPDAWSVYLTFSSRRGPITFVLGQHPYLVSWRYHTPCAGGTNPQPASHCAMPNCKCANTLSILNSSIASAFPTSLISNPSDMSVFHYRDRSNKALRRLIPFRR